MTTDFTTDPTPTKHCSKCDQDLPATAEYFHRNKKTNDGLAERCKKCKSEVFKKWYYDNHKEQIERVQKYRDENRKEVRRRGRAQKKEAYKADPEKFKRQSKAWYAEHKEDVLATNKEWAKANPEKAAAIKRKHFEANRDAFRKNADNWRKNNPDKARKMRQLYYQATKSIKRLYKKLWRLANPEKDKAMQHRRLARKRGLPDTLTATEWRACLDYFEGCCAACGDTASLFSGLEADHFVPLSSPDCIGTVKENIIPLCRTCNTSKSGKDALAWATEKFGKHKGKEFMLKVQAYFDSLKA